MGLLWLELINGCCDKHRNRSVAAYPAFSCHSCASSLFLWPYHTPWQPLKYLLPSGISANHLLKCQDTLEAAVSEKICSGSHICCDEEYYVRESFPPAGGSTLCHTLKRVKWWFWWAGGLLSQELSTLAGTGTQFANLLAKRYHCCCLTVAINNPWM